uniref:EF-hand domain-containing protein n=1 Tax=Eutreptiella gymnastica TaxID=73025 RepID=A0A7S4D363_9EUGL
MVDADAPAPASNGGPSNLKLTRSTKSLRALSPKGSSLPSVLKSLQERKQNTPQRRKIMRCWWVIVAVTRLRRTARVKLTAAEMEFVKGVYDKSGGLRSMLQVRDVLAQCGQNLTDNELEALLQQVKYHEGFIMTLREFTQIMELLKRQYVNQQDADTGDAFVALGGNRDRTGEISASQLRSVVRYFNLTIDIDKLIEDCDSSGDGLIEYGEFRGMFDNLTEDDGSISGTQSTYINMATGHSPLDRIGSADAIIGGWWKVGYQVREARTAPRETRHVAADALDDSVHSSQSDGSNDDNPEQEAAAPATALPSKGSGGSKTQKKGSVKRKRVVDTRPRRKAGFLARGLDLADLEQCVSLRNINMQSALRAVKFDKPHTAPTRTLTKRYMSSHDLGTLGVNLEDDAMQPEVVTSGDAHAVDWRAVDYKWEQVMALHKSGSRSAKFSLEEKLARWSL